ncbi:GNAT family N-acetyltransferase [Clostridium sp. D2Q-14]|uniref:GNAT family N-acetyltransferase n=1 Tax=Anaeromonas gelatinilytica TaxID=2683194 RepID=UPI00193B358C|nr:GNAT family protein [Anaeromonas gelatinilytica]MBS4535684.1 GNAT family N-acetyltransferase [Anaeromonas gelatinilytica]
MLKIRAYNPDKDSLFVEGMIESEEYDMNINYSTLKKTFNRDSIYVLEYKDRKYGFCEYYEVDDLNKNLSLNIIFTRFNKYINGKFILEIIRKIFREDDYNKLIIKVREENKRMLRILQKNNIHCEGVISNIKTKDNVLTNIYIYSILRSEYLYKHEEYN